MIAMLHWYVALLYYAQLMSLVGACAAAPE